MYFPIARRRRPWLSSFQTWTNCFKYSGRIALSGQGGNFCRVAVSVRWTSAMRGINMLPIFRSSIHGFKDYGFWLHINSTIAFVTSSAKYFPLLSVLTSIMAFANSKQSAVPSFGISWNSASVDNAPCLNLLVFVSVAKSQSEHWVSCRIENHIVLDKPRLSSIISPFQADTWRLKGLMDWTTLFVFFCYMDLKVQIGDPVCLK